MDTPKSVFEKCMNGSLRNLVKGGLFYKYFQSPFYVWCEAFAPAEEKDPPSAYMEMILGNGRVHEQEVCEEQFKGGLDIDPTQHEKAFLQTLEGLFRGEELIKNGIFYILPQQFVAVPDVLVKKPGPSLFGTHYYEVVEIKSSKQIKEEHIMQAAFYNHVIGFIQGVTPEKFSLIDGQKNSEEFLYADYEQKVKDTIHDIKEIFKGKPVRPEKLGWPWETFSLGKLKEQKHISLIPNLFAAHRDTLIESGVQTLEDFFSLNVLKIQGIHFDTLEKYRRQAKAILVGRHSFLEKPFLPEGKTEIFMDFEGVESLRSNGRKISGDYLIGVLIRENGTEAFHSFVAENPEQEHSMLFDFLKFLKKQKEYVIYHFGTYERSHLATLFHKYGIDEAFATQILGSMVDIYQIARKSVIFPVHSYSLKEIGKYLGYSWKDVADAKDSIALYLDFIEKGNKEAMEKIIQYNKDDCVALKRVKDFLVWGV